MHKYFPQYFVLPTAVLITFINKLLYSICMYSIYYIHDVGILYVRVSMNSECTMSMCQVINTLT